MGWLLGATAISAQEPPPSSLDVATPVHGYFVFAVDNRLYLLDTFTGELRVLDEASDGGSIGDPQWNLQGDTIAYYNRLLTKTLKPFSPGTTPSVVVEYDSDKGLFLPEDWSPDGSEILGLVSGSYINYSEVQAINANGGSATILRHDVNGESLAEDSQLELFELRNASWNPVFDEWIVVEIYTFIEGTEDNPERPGVYIGMVFNIVTGEKHMLDEAMFYPIERIPSGSAWSPDGRRLVIETDTFARTEIVTVLDENGAWAFHPEISARTYDLFSVDGWLGVEDLLLILKFDDATSTIIFSIGQIIDGEWFMTEFFSIPIYEVSDARFPSIGAGSFHLAADEEERARLSCLFDQTLPARLGVGMRGQTTYPYFGASYLRAYPGMESETVSWMAERTPFEVIGGAYCKDGFRWLELRLDDGTTGWSAEADRERYFLEPTGR
jgi:hypothetical protein